MPSPFDRRSWAGARCAPSEMRKTELGNNTIKLLLIFHIYDNFNDGELLGGLNLLSMTPGLRGVWGSLLIV